METSINKPSLGKRFLNRIANLGGLQWRATISANSDGLTVTNWESDGTITTQFAKWNEITEAVAYKQDCFAADQIRIGLTTSDGALIVTEDMQGWKELVDQ